MALTLKNNDTSMVNAHQSDLELHLLQTFIAYTSHHLQTSYVNIKHMPRMTRFLTDMTETFVSRAGLVALVRLLYHQYLQLGHPFVQQVDDAMGKRVINAVVSILMLTEQQPEDSKDLSILTLKAAETDNDDTQMSKELLIATKLSYKERFQALLLGVVPRMEQALMQARHELLEETARQDIAPVVMELKDFVPVDEVVRLKEESKEQLQQAMLEATRLRTQMMELMQEKQRLEQRLTDVHNYQESERGRRFQKMEEDLARTKLEANQKTQEVRELQLRVETLRRKHKKKSKNRKNENQSDTSESAPPSSVPENPSMREYEGKRSRQSSNVTA